jgi:hypothetical protein
MVKLEVNLFFTTQPNPGKTSKGSGIHKGFILLVFLASFCTKSLVCVKML